MTTYYVSSSVGSDSSAGTSEANAWQTLAKVGSSTFTNGDFVLLKRGDVWRETLTFPSSGTTNNVITISSYGDSGAKPTINGASIITGWNDAGLGVSTFSRVVATQPLVVLLNGSYTTNGTAAASLNENEWFWSNSTLYFRSNAGNPDTVGLVLEAGARNQAFFLNPQSHIKLDGVRVVGTNGRAYRNNGGSNNEVANCDFLFCGDSDGAGVIVWNQVTTGTGGRIIGNTIYRCRTDGMFLFNSKNLEVLDNYILSVFSTNADGIHFNNPTVGSIVSGNYIDIQFTDSTKGCIITDNSASSNMSFVGNVCIGGNYGISCGGNQNVIHRNLCINQASSGTLFASGLYLANTSSSSLTVTRNAVINSANGFYGFGSRFTNLKLYHNSFVSCFNTGLRFDSSASISGEFKNNLITTSVFSDHAIAINSSVTTIASQSWVMDYNVLNPQTANKFVQWFGTNYDTLSAYSNAQGQDTHSTTADPKASVAGRVGPGSPAVNAGLAIAGVNDGFAGSAPDIGAYEVGVPSWAVPTIVRAALARQAVVRPVPVEAGRLVDNANEYFDSRS